MRYLAGFERPNDELKGRSMRNLANTFFLAVALVVAGGMILIFISRARKLSGRSKCQNNLRQIAVAIHNYESANGSLPAATVRNSGLSPEKRLSWLAEISSFIESTNPFSGLRHDKPWDDDLNRFAAVYPVPLFQCPRLADQRPKSELFSTSYVGIAGLGTDAAELPLDDPRAGVFGYDRVLKLNGKTNLRLSSLLAVMETTNMRESCMSGGPPTVRGLETDSIIGDVGEFGELGGDGANCMVLDGSVHFLRNSIDIRVLRKLATFNGSTQLEPPQ